MYMKGSYTSSTHVLVKTRVSSASPDLAIVCSYDGDYDDVGFTVTVYSSAPASWMEESVKMSYNKTMASAFTTKNAGGNSTYSSFMVNPQYHLRINYDNTLTPANGREKKPRMQLKVQGDRRIPFNISIVWTGSQDRRVRDVVQNEIAATSGAYTHGFASITKKLAAGDYTVIVSAFEPRYFGPFSLTVGGTHRFELTPIPQEGAGMFSKVVRGAWTEVTSAGGPSFKQYTSNPCYEMTVSSQTEVKIRLQVVDAPRPLSINATVFNLNGDTLGSHVTTSGPYSDANSGVITPQIMLQPARYVIVPSTYSPGLEASFRLIVYSTDSGILVTSTVLGSAH